MARSLPPTKTLRQLATATVLACTMLAIAGLYEHASATARKNWSHWAQPSTLAATRAKPTAIVPLNAKPRMAKSRNTVHGFSHGKIVPFSSRRPRGTIIVNTKAKRLFYVLGGGQAVQYPVATARSGFEWSGRHKVSRKRKWPSWSPPESMRKRSPELPAYMAGGPNNPLGARAIYLGTSIYRIHGTNAPASIGQSASSGCIRMHNADVEELYRHVEIGALVIVI